MRLLSASLAFSSAEIKIKKQNKTKKHTQIVNWWESKHQRKMSMKTLISPPTHQSSQGDLLSLLLAQHEFWNESMSIYKTY